jgi:hypothetical protein
MPLVAWVTGPAILAHVRVTSPTPEQSAWADACAGAVDAGINSLCGFVPAIDDASPAAIAEITPNALTAGGDAYRRQDAPFGMTSYADLAGVAARVARDYLESIRPQLERYRHVENSIA